MTEVISIRYKSCGKNYYFSPDGLQINAGDKVVVETAKGLELAECTRGNRMVEDTAVVQPLRPVVRIATEQDLKNAEENKNRESEALAICRERVEAHGLDMKLVDAEISFDGSKTLFFFTSEGRVDFRELVKDLAGVFHNRIELRQIGVRDEAKMIGGIGICGRPYCCSVFLDDFAPVSTKMAKVQNLSLNPTKISGSCGRLMCCLRYEEDTYEELLKEVPKTGAFVETPDGYGIVTGIALLRQNIKVHLDGDADDAEHVYPNAAVAVIPGGRPKDGEPYPKVLNYKPEEVEKAPDPVEKDVWNSPSLFGEMPAEHSIEAHADENTAEAEPKKSERQSGRHSGRGSRSFEKHDTKPVEARAEVPVKDAPSADGDSSANAASAKEISSEKHERRSNDKYGSRRHGKGQHNSGKTNDSEKSSAGGDALSGGNTSSQNRSDGKPHGNAKAGGKNRNSDAKPQGSASSPNKTQEDNTEAAKAGSTHENRSPRSGNHRHGHHNESRPNDGNAPKQEKKEPKPQPAAGEAAGSSVASSAHKPHKNYHHRYYGNKKKPGGSSGEAKQ